MVTNEIRDKFKKLYCEKFGITLSDEEATEMAMDLVNLVKVLLKPEQKSHRLSISQEEGSRDETIRIQHYQ